MATTLLAKYPKLTFEEINKNFHDKFLIFLQQKQDFSYTIDKAVKRYTKKELSNGAVANYIKNLKLLMRLAKERGLTNNSVYLERWFAKPTNSPSGKTEVVLSEEEIKKIYDYTPETQALEEVKDMFLIGCYSGLRVSDYTSLSKKHFKETEKGTQIITKSTQKTRVNTHIPILWEELTKIAEKYDYCFPSISSYKINKYIKEICKKMNIFNEIIMFKDIVGGETKDYEYEKWQLITTHTGRRSAITNLKKRGVSDEAISSFTGQKSSSIIRLYNKTTSEHSADLLQGIFKKSNIA